MYNAILLAARLLHQQGTEVYGKSDLFEAFLSVEVDEDTGDDRTGELGSSRKGTQTLAKHFNFEQEVGNRAHITFHNGAALWYHRKDIDEFLQLFSIESGKDVMKQLQELLATKVPLAGARALGIIKALISGPFQTAFDKQCKNILDMVPYCVQMRVALQEFSEDATELLTHPKSVFPDLASIGGKIEEELFVDTGDPELDGLTVLALQLILKNHLILFEQQCAMYLPGGEFAAEVEKETVRNCPLTNRACERNMGILDKQVQRKPNATPGYIEASVLLQTSDIEPTSMAEDERKKVFEIARKYATEDIEKNKEMLKR